MANAEETTWYAGLDTLDGFTADFRSDKHAASISIPRSDWEAMGRPGTVKFTPEATEATR